MLDDQSLFFTAKKTTLEKQRDKSPDDVTYKASSRNKLSRSNKKREESNDKFIKSQPKKVVRVVHGELARTDLLAQTYNSTIDIVLVDNSEFRFNLKQNSCVRGCVNLVNCSFPGNFEIFLNEEEVPLTHRELLTQIKLGPSVKPKLDAAKFYVQLFYSERSFRESGQMTAVKEMMLNTYKEISKGGQLSVEEIRAKLKQSGLSAGSAVGIGHADLTVVHKTFEFKQEKNVDKFYFKLVAQEPISGTMEFNFVLQSNLKKLDVFDQFKLQHPEMFPLPVEGEESPKKKHSVLKLTTPHKRTLSAGRDWAHKHEEALSRKKSLADFQSLRRELIVKQKAVLKEAVSKVFIKGCTRLCREGRSTEQTDESVNVDCSAQIHCVHSNYCQVVRRYSNPETESLQDGQNDPKATTLLPKFQTQKPNDLRVVDNQPPNEHSV